jgi:nucleoside 2-deoxyribosyltransferase/predicted Rossmann-fold nucleotide-binding protein
MLKILVAAGVDADDPKADSVRSFCRALAEKLIAQGHVLLNGCQTELDKVLAEAAYNKLLALGVTDVDSRLVSYVLEGRPAAHKFGRILQSVRKDWDVNTAGLSSPETIELADALILVSGYDGTLRAANWARIGKKPLLPVTLFGGAAKQIYLEELSRFNESYAGRVEKIDYALLNQVTDDGPKLAADVVALAERVSISRSVFIVMSFSQDEALVDACESFKEAGEKLGYKCSRVDDSNAADRILPEILEKIRQSAFVIADLSEPKPNVYYELGFAHALGKPTIVTAKEGTQLPFDVKDVPTVFWKGQKQLKDKLAEKIRAIAVSQGRML